MPFCKVPARVAGWRFPRSSTIREIEQAGRGRFVGWWIRNRNEGALEIQTTEGWPANWFQKAGNRRPKGLSSEVRSLLPGLPRGNETPVIQVDREPEEEVGTELYLAEFLLVKRCLPDNYHPQMEGQETGF